MTREQLLDIRAQVKLIEIHARNLKNDSTTKTINQRMNRILQETNELKKTLDFEIKELNGPNKEQTEKITKK